MMEAPVPIRSARRLAAQIGSALLLSLAPAHVVHAQQATLAGTVRDMAGAPVPGAHIQLPAYGIGTSADAQGGFRLPLPADASGSRVLIRATSIGFAPRDTMLLLAAVATPLELRLRASAVPLDEVLVTGTAGARERRSQPATVATVDVQRLGALVPLRSLPEVMQGRVASLDVTPSSGSAGGAQRTRLRGAGSISLGNEPIFFIDGVRADARIQGTNGNGGQASSRLLDLQPDDIERVEIVRGPSAATLYGADASAGVIHVITRRGVAGAGAFQQTVTGEYGGVAPNWTPPDNFARCGPGDVDAQAPTLLCRGRAEGDVVSDNPLLRSGVLRSGALHSFAWSGRGGGETYGFYLSVRTDEEEGTLPQNGFTRHAGRFNFRFVPASNVGFDLAFGLARSRTLLPQSEDNPLGYLAGGLLGDPLNAGRGNDGWFGASPVEIGRVQQPNDVLRVTPSVRVRYAQRDWLTHRITLGADATHSRGRLFFPRVAAGARGFFDEGWVGEDRVHHEIYTLEYLGNATFALSPDRAVVADVAAGVQLIATRDDYLEATGYGLVTNGANTVAGTANRSGTQFRTEERALGFIAQGEIAQHNRRYLQLAVRIDRNSSFGERTAPYAFPKVGASWVVSDEPFWRVAALPTLRLRGVLGTTGRAPPAGAALRTYAPAPFLYAPGRIEQGVSPLTEGNEHLKPERGTEVELGFDAALPGERVGVEMTFFRKRTTDLLLRRPVPPSFGFPRDPFVNIGAVTNRGMEATVSARLVESGPVVAAIDVGFSTLRNRVDDLGDVAAFATEDGNFRIAAGRPLGAVYTRRIKRLDVESGRAIVGDSAEFAGHPEPRWLGFLTPQLTLFGRVRLHANFDWKAGHRLYNVTAHMRERAFTIGERRVRMDELPAAERISRFGPFFTEAGERVSAPEVAGAYLQDAGFLRWRELAATVELPSKLAGRVRATGGSLTLAGRNLALWTEYDGDPEVVSQMALGAESQFSYYDFLNLPQPRRWSARLKLDF